MKFCKIEEKNMLYPFGGICFLLAYVFFIFLFGCLSKESIYLIKSAENIWEQYPDSSLSLLERIEDPESLPEKYFMKYNLLRLKVYSMLDISMEKETGILDIIEYYRKKNDNYNLSHSLLLAANVYFQKGKWETARDILNQSMVVSQQYGYHDMYAISAFELGEIHEILKSYSEAFFHYHSMLANEHLNDDQGIKASILKRLGDVHLATHQLDSSLFYYDISYQLSMERDVAWKATISKNMAISCLTAGQIDQAKGFIDRLLYLVDGGEGMSICYLLLSDLYRQENKLDSAVIFNIKAIRHAEEQKDSRALNYYNHALYFLVSFIHDETFDWPDLISDYKLHRNLDSSWYSKRKYRPFVVRQQVAEYEKMRSRARALVIRNQSHVILLCGICIGVFILLAVIENRNRKTKKKHLSELEKKEELLKKISTSAAYRLDVYRRIVLISIAPGKKRYAEFLKDINRLLYGKEEIFCFDWDTFESIIQDVYTDFVPALQSVFSALSETEIKICYLLKGGFANPDIAILTGFSVNAIYKHNTIIRKKLYIPVSGSIVSYIDSIMDAYTNQA